MELLGAIVGPKWSISLRSFRSRNMILSVPNNQMFCMQLMMLLLLSLCSCNRRWDIAAAGTTGFARPSPKIRRTESRQTYPSKPAHFPSCVCCADEWEVHDLSQPTRDRDLWFKLLYVHKIRRKKKTYFLIGIFGVLCIYFVLLQLKAK